MIKKYGINLTSLSNNDFKDPVGEFNDLVHLATRRSEMSRSDRGELLALGRKIKNFTKPLFYSPSSYPAFSILQ